MSTVFSAFFNLWNLMTFVVSFPYVCPLKDYHYFVFFK